MKMERHASPEVWIYILRVVRRWSDSCFWTKVFLWSGVSLALLQLSGKEPLAIDAIASVDMSKGRNDSVQRSS